LLAIGDFEVIGLPGAGGLAEVIPSTAFAVIKVLPVAFSPAVALSNRTTVSMSDVLSGSLTLTALVKEPSFRTKVYDVLKQAIIEMDIYSSSEPRWIDERQISEKLGISRTPIREALAVLEREGFVASVPRKGTFVVRKTKREIVEMIEAWAALESMAVRLITLRASDQEIATLRKLFSAFNETYKPSEHLTEYSKANIDFHQAVIRLSGSKTLFSLTNDLLLHVRGIRQITINRAYRSDQTIYDHLAIIDALERRETELAERLSREHTLVLARYIEQQPDGIFD
jgi:DNA-binding GntR family transcriptional regulator